MGRHSGLFSLARQTAKPGRLGLPWLVLPWLVLPWLDLLWLVLLWLVLLWCHGPPCDILPPPSRGPVTNCGQRPWRGATAPFFFLQGGKTHGPSSSKTRFLADAPVRRLALPGAIWVRCRAWHAADGHAADGYAADGRANLSTVHVHGRFPTTIRRSARQSAGRYDHHRIVQHSSSWPVESRQAARHERTRPSRTPLRPDGDPGGPQQEPGHRAAIG